MDDVKAVDKTTCVGTAPMAAISLRLDATDLKPTSYHWAVFPIMKWLFWTIVSMTVTCCQPGVVR